MIFYIIKWTFIYVILIFLLHNLYLFFQSNLTSTKIKDYYNTYNSESNNTYNNNNNNNNNNNSAQVKNSNAKKTLTHSNNLQVNSTNLEELNNYTGFNNMEFTNQEFINQEFINHELTNNSNGLTNSMKSELNDFFNKLKL